MYCKFLRDQYKINLILVEINLKPLQIKFHTHLFRGNSMLIKQKSLRARSILTWFGSRLRIRVKILGWFRIRI
jgi:hypothetical protein